MYKQTRERIPLVKGGHDMIEKMFQMLSAQQEFDPPKDELTDLINSVLNADAGVEVPDDLLDENDLEWVRAARKDGPVPPFKPMDLK